MPLRRTATLTVMALGTAFACSEAGGPQVQPSPTGATPAGWRVHTEAAYRFVVAYPPDLGVLPEKSAPASDVVKRVRFQDTGLMSSQFAELEPPRFTIEVFVATPSISLVDWLRSTGRLPEGAAVSDTTLAGATDGVRVQLRRQLAPNEFFYFSTNEYVYRLTLLGLYSPEMFASFRLL